MKKQSITHKVFTLGVAAIAPRQCPEKKAIQYWADGAVKRSGRRKKAAKSFWESSG
ncbi:MAG TPA: hypothetical protein PLE32_04165 [Haliscomenobacter sp.]|nr:hypothetical protein [Haliscomenobacter sp.]